MTSVPGEDVWGDEDFLNALILATENASAAASSSSGGASLPLPGNSARHTSGDGVPASYTDHAAASTSSRHSPFERQFSDPLLPPPPRPVRVAPRPPPPVSLASNRSQAPWQEWDDFFADGNLELFDIGVDTRACNFSPPRELSQREKRTDSHVAEDRRENKPESPKNASRELKCFGGVRVEKDPDKEIERLKREMDKVLKKLDRMERERCEIQEDRAKKDKELEQAFSEIFAKNMEIESLKKEKLEGIPSKEDNQLCDASNEPIAPSIDPSSELLLPEDYMKKRKTNKSGKPSLISNPQSCIVNDGKLTSNGRLVQGGDHHTESFQLQGTKAIGVQTELNDSDPTTRELGQIHNVKLLSMWGFTPERKSGRYFISRLLRCCTADLFTLFRFAGVPSNINIDLDDLTCSSQSVEAQKVSHLYSIMMKIGSEMLHLDDLLEALTGLCELGNIMITYRSLRILHALLRIICFNQSLPRDNIIVHPFSAGILPDLEREIAAANRPSKLSLSLNRRASLFEIMHGIIVSNTKTSVLVEAISIMNLILQKSHPILERDKLGLIPSFASVSYLLSREVDFCAQRQAVKQLFLLLNCPKHLKVFCNCCNGDIGPLESVDGADAASRLHQSVRSAITGLADCIDHRLNITQDRILCREVVILLAFLASSGQSGFEILLNPIPKRGNFLRLIIEVMASQMKEADSCDSQDLRKERCALIRESLILLNRLSSNNAYSKATLGALTQSTAMAAMALDVATRASHDHDAMNAATPMEVEISHLARLFRSRLLSFLGEDPS